MLLTGCAGQDVASKGLGLIYDVGDDATKKELVGLLVGTLSEGHKSRVQKFTTTSEDQVRKRRRKQKKKVTENAE